MSNESNHFGSGFIVGTITATAIGTLTALLMSSKRGEELKKKAVDTFHDVEDAAENLLHSKPNVKKKIASAYHHVKDDAEHLVHKQSTKKSKKPTEKSAHKAHDDQDDHDNHKDKE